MKSTHYWVHFPAVSLGQWSRAEHSAGTPRASDLHNSCTQGSYPDNCGDQWANLVHTSPEVEEMGDDSREQREGRLLSFSFRWNLDMSSSFLIRWYREMCEAQGTKGMGDTNFWPHLRLRQVWCNDSWKDSRLQVFSKSPLTVKWSHMGPGSSLPGFILLLPAARSAHLSFPSI